MTNVLWTRASFGLRTNTVSSGRVYLGSVVKNDNDFVAHFLGKNKTYYRHFPRQKDAMTFLEGKSQEI